MAASGVMKDLLLIRNSDWLQARRSRFVPQSDSATDRNSLLAGRTGTRANGGKPQQRWDAGISLARSFLRSRSGSLCSNNALSVSTRIRNAVSEVIISFLMPVSLEIL